MANNFKLTLDTLAPQGSISRLAEHEFIKANVDLTIDKGDATYMKVWFDTTAQGTKESEGYTSASWEAAATSKKTNFIKDGQYYYHVVLMDDVNNESVVYNTDMITFDATAPVIENFYLADTDSADKDYSNSRTVKYHFDYSDNMSGCAKAVLKSDKLAAEINVADIALNGKAEGEITFVEDTQGSVTVELVVTDRSGNESTIATSSIFVDTGVSTLSLLLKTSEGESLPGFINYNGIVAHLKSADTDLVGYKFWEGDAEPTAYESLEVGSALALDIPHTLSAGDGKKVLHAKVIDRAGTESEVATAEVVYDITIPAISLSCDRTIISNVEGFEKAVLTITAEDLTAGIDNYNIKVGETSISSGNATVPGTFEITSVNSLAEGLNVITLTVTDKAGNSDSKSVNLILDTTAPTVTAPQLEAWYKEGFAFNAVYSDANKLTTVYAWVNEVATDQVIPSEITNINATASGQEIPASQVKFNPIQSENNYLHIAVKDEVGNIGYAHVKFGFDNVKPEGTIKFEKLVYGTVSARAIITYEDATSGVTHMEVAGDVSNPSSDWEGIAESRDITLTSEEGMKSVKIRFKDKAGNVSDWFEAPNQCELDTSKPSATIVLYKADGITSKPQVSAEAAVVARIGYTDTDTIGGMEYKLYGDYVGSSTEWKSFVKDDGQIYMSIPVTAIAPTDDKKVERVFNVVVRDNAGNESPVATASFWLDPTEPEADVTGVDYNVISKVHVLRRNAEGEIAGKFADEVHFTIVPSEIITEWKVCAYLDEVAAKAGKPTDAAIPMTNESVHMSGETSSSANIDCTIKGADYELALGGEGHDGAHYVVVYIKNEAGLWSKSAFAA
jgi:hypothetical protein